MLLWLQVAQLVKDQAQELQKLRNSIKSEHDLLSSSLAQHQSRVTTVAQQQEALASRIEAAVTQQAAGETHALAASAGIAASMLSNTQPAAETAQQVSAGSTAHNQVHAGQGPDGLFTEQDSADVAASVAVLLDEDDGLQGVQRAALTTEEKPVDILGVPSATSSVAVAPFGAKASPGSQPEPLATDSNTPSATTSMTTSSVVSGNDSTPARVSGDKAGEVDTPSATSSVVADVSGTTDAAATAGALPVTGNSDAGSDASNVPAATSSVVASAGGKQQSTGKQRTGQQPQKPATRMPVLKKAVAQGSILGLGAFGTQPGHQLGQQAGNMQQDDTDREVQEALKGGTGADIDHGEQLAKEELSGSGEEPNAASSVAGAPDAVADQGRVDVRAAVNVLPVVDASLGGVSSRTHATQRASQDGHANRGGFSDSTFKLRGA